MLRFFKWVQASLLRKILLIIVSVNMLLYIIFAHVMFFNIKHTVENGAKESLTLQSKGVADALDAYFYDKANLATILSNNDSIYALLSAKTPRSNALNSEYAPTIINALDSVNSTYADIDMVWLASEYSNYAIYSDGTMTNENYDLQQRPWHEPCSQITNEEQVWFSSTVQSYHTTENTVMMVKPVFGEGEIIGYIGLNIFLSSFSDIINQIVDINGECLLISEEGTVIYSKDPSIISKNVKEINTQKVRSVAKEMLSSNNDFTIADFDDSNYYLSYHAIADTGWSVATYIDTENINLQLTTFNVLFMGNIIVGIAILGILLYAILRHSLKNFPFIIQAVSRLAEGDYSARINATSIDEIGRIANAIDSMSSELEEKTKIIQNYAQFDSLTGLANRRMLLDEMEASVAEAGTKMSQLAVCCIDLDDFKWVNDTLGHCFGDELLLRFAEVLSSCKRTGDIVSRFGGDEFMLIFRDIEDAGDVQEFFDHVLTKLQRPISVLNHEIYLRFTAGVSLYPNDGTTSDELIKNCDMAMYSAKASGKNRIEYYDTSIQQNITLKAHINQALSKALEQDEFTLHYQPIVSAEDRCVHGVEVLIRWHSKELGPISPAEFIPIAEETGAIVNIGTWILRKSCETHKRLCETYGKDLVLSVNISPEQMKQPDFTKIVKDVLYTTGINPRLLQLEITEGVLINFMRNANDTITQLVNLGVRIALDDFGTGYSSLSYLKYFPIDVLKIDKSFIDEIVRNRKDYSITSSIIELVHKLNIVTVAEGVETAEQFSFLHEMSCDYIQGFLISKPLKEDDIIEYLSADCVEEKL